MIPVDISKFTEDVKKMRDAQKRYFLLRKDPNTPSEEVWAVLRESKRLEKIVDDQLDEGKPEDPSLF